MTCSSKQPLLLLTLGVALDLKFTEVQALPELNLINQGGISEQVVGQLLRTIEPFYKEPSLYYWSREEKHASAELDYLLTHEGEVVPIEVKSGSSGGLKSLHLFMALKQRKLAVRINSELPSLTPVQVKTSRGEEANYQLLSLPFYLVGQIYRLIEAVKS